MNLLGISTFVLPVPIVEAALDAIRAAARTHDEAFVALTGVADGTTFAFRRAVVPRQTAHKTRHGLLVTMDGDSLFELNRDCDRHGDVLAGQIHGHPDTAYHSAADDELALVGILGGLSIVVPQFARQGLEGVSRWACYQRRPGGRWSGLPASVNVMLQ
jgi:hypothetical protein